MRHLPTPYPTLYGFRVGGWRLSDKNAPTCACGVVVCHRRSLRRSQEMDCRNHMVARRCKTGMQAAKRNSTFLSIFSLRVQVEIDQNHFSRTFPRPIQCHHIWARVSVLVNISVRRPTFFVTGFDLWKWKREIGLGILSFGWEAKRCLWFVLRPAAAAAAVPVEGVNWKPENGNEQPGRRLISGPLFATCA